jgi:hypothetical protein
MALTPQYPRSTATDTIEVNQHVSDPVVAEVIRETAGRDRLRHWLQHALEETPDRAVYRRRAIEQIEREEAEGHE